MSEASQALKARTENFAVGVVKFCETLPNTIAGRKTMAGTEELKIVGWTIGGMLADFGIKIGRLRVHLTK